MNATLELPALPAPRPITTPVARPNQDWVQLGQMRARLAALKSRSMFTYTTAECMEYIELERAIALLTDAMNERLDRQIAEEDRRRAADLIHDTATEAHAFPCNPNIHDD